MNFKIWYEFFFDEARKSKLNQLNRSRAQIKIPCFFDYKHFRSKLEIPKSNQFFF